jgi:hypothetical protein
VKYLKYVRSIVIRREIRNIRRNKPPEKLWNNSNPHFLKANCDVNISKVEFWGIGVVIRNEEGLFMATTTWYMQNFADLNTTGSLLCMKS